MAAAGDKASGHPWIKRERRLVLVTPFHENGQYSSVDSLGRRGGNRLAGLTRPNGDWLWGRFMPSAPRTPIRPRRPAAMDRGRWATELVVGMSVMPPNPAHPKVIVRRTCATGVQAACRHPGELAARRRHGRAASRPARIPPPHAGGRGDGPAGGGHQDGPSVSLCAGSALCHPTPGYPDVIAPRNCATGVQVARRRPGEVAERIRPLGDAHEYRTPPGDRHRGIRAESPPRPQWKFGGER